MSIRTHVHVSKVPTRWFSEESKFRCDRRVTIYVKTEEGRWRRQSTRGKRTCTCDLTQPDRSYGICMKRRACACGRRSFLCCGPPGSDLLHGIFSELVLGAWLQPERVGGHPFVCTCMCVLKREKSVSKVISSS